MSKELFIPMSSLQCAYMIERERGLKTTGTPCHVYMEFDTVSINETHLRKAWETLYVRHPMMRAKAEMCGLLKIEELNDREAERTIKIWEEDIFIKENMREILSHEKLDIRNGINCRLHLIKRHQKIVRLAFDLDLTMCDVLSFLIILRDLGEFYRYFKRGIIREYHSNEIEEEVLLSENRKSDKVYWEQRLRNSDIAFPLKVKGSIEELVKTKYISINRKMDKKVLDRLTLKLKISTEEILLIVFSYTVLKYTKKEQVLINFPFSNRTKERQNRVGDYTKKQELCPVGKEGQMYIAGDGVTPGYVGTGEQGKFTEYKGLRVYCSGDYGVYMRTGEILFRGRKDRQIKINGKRIELDGIEEKLNSIKGITKGAVICKDKRIVAYYVAEDKTEVNNIKKILSGILPEYMIPTAFYEIKRLPYNRNKKVDYRELERMVPKTGEQEKAETELEDFVARICENIFEVEKIGVKESFYNLGGDSVTAMRIAAIIKKEFNVHMTPYDIFEHSTIRELASYIAKLRSDINEKV
mgnify:CR=1 FL=1